ncbi:DUF1674 domain-containing protein [Bartonella tamiae]|uniref:DUF1674 domain-containing protein n=1 Tax=Bartonella tamiae TaxID=373638 RepID=UPI003CC90BEC
MLTDKKTADKAQTLDHAAKKLTDLPPPAQRALAEAEERRKHNEHKNMAKEIGGRGGTDPARYGDWEIKGRAIDF